MFEQSVLSNWHLECEFDMLLTGCVFNNKLCYLFIFNSFDYNDKRRFHDDVICLYVGLVIILVSLRNNM